MLEDAATEKNSRFRTKGRGVCAHMADPAGGGRAVPASLFISLLLAQENDAAAGVTARHSSP